METCEAERVIQRLRGGYRRDIVEKKLDNIGEEGDPASAQLILRTSETVPDPNTVRPLRFHGALNSKAKGTQNQDSAKSHLYEICAINHWKAPLFECCNEEGPDHHKLFTFKVIIEIRGPRMATIECMGNPHLNKKAAAENAAEGALWYLNQDSAKSHLYEICADNHWKAPLFECCNEEGPDHHKLFTFKVIVEIRGPRMVTIECIGNPHLKKKDAAENAAEGVLWYLNQAD